MILEHIGLKEINGSLVVLDDVDNASNEEMVELHLDDGSVRAGRIVKIVASVWSSRCSRARAACRWSIPARAFSGHPMELPLSPEILGRVFDGLGRPIDGMGEVYPTCRRDVNGAPINPVSRVYPRDYINTGIFFHRRVGHADPRPEAADLLRFRHEAQ